MFLVLTGMPVTVQAADYDGGTGERGEDAGDIFKNVSGRSGLCGTGYVDQRGAVSGAEGKFSFSVMVQELLADGIGVTSMEKNRTVAV